MKWDRLYRGIVHTAYGLTKLQGLKMHVSGAEHIPSSGGGVVVINHTGYLDFLFGAYIPRERGRLVRYMAKEPIFRAPVAGRLMVAMNHIPVDRINGQASLDKAVELASAGELVGIFPEATISRSFEIKDFKQGAVRIAQAAGVPLIPTVIFGSQRIWTKGQPKNLGRSKTPVYIDVLPPWRPDPNAPPEEETEKLRGVMRDGLEALWRRYREDYGDFPEGEAWVPARFGGGAPTLAATRVEDDAVQGERRRVRRLTGEVGELDRQVKDLNDSLAMGVYDGDDPRPEGTPDDEDERPGEPGLAEWVRGTVEELVAEGAKEAKEGRDKAAAALEELRCSVGELSANLAEAGRARYQGSRLESTLTGLAGRARHIIDKLPQRAGGRLNAPPAAVVCDLEGALLQTSGEPAEEDLEALTDYASAGGAIVVSSEYGTEEIRRATERLPKDTVEVAYSGAVISRGGEPMRVSALGEETRAAIAEAAQRAGAGAVEWRTTWRGDDVVAAVVARPGRDADIVAGTLAGELGERALVRATSPARILIVSPEAGGDAGLGWLFERLGVDPGEAAAFGDSAADLAILGAVGHPVAMANASKAALEASSYTTGDHDSAGVAEFLAPLLDDAKEG